MIIPHDVQAVPLWQVALLVGLVYVAHGLVKSYRARARSTPLGCPPRPSWLFGMSRLIMNNPDASSMYEAWVHQFGTVFKIPGPMGNTRVILTDPKAVAHFYSVDTCTYVQTKLSRVSIENLVRSLLVWTPPCVKFKLCRMDLAWTRAIVGGGRVSQEVRVTVRCM